LCMPLGPKKHVKQVVAPTHWMLDKLTGMFAPRPSSSPHKLRKCFPLFILLRSRLTCALTGDEVKKTCMQLFLEIDGKVPTNVTHPAGFVDVISIDKTGENFRLNCDTKGSLCCSSHYTRRGQKNFHGAKGTAHLVTHDAQTMRAPDPLSRFDIGNLCMVTGGANLGRIGVLTNTEGHSVSFDVAQQQTMEFSSLRKRYRDWQPNRAVGSSWNLFPLRLACLLLAHRWVQVGFDPESQSGATHKQTLEALMDREAIRRSLENLGEQRLQNLLPRQRYSRGGYFLVDFYAPTVTGESITKYFSRGIAVIRQNIVKYTP
ncbi:40S ribosomal protein S4, partial [Galemys pyrenaicus]